MTLTQGGRRVRVPQYRLTGVSSWLRCLPAHRAVFRLSLMRPEAARAQLDALRALSAEQRLLIAESLRAFAWELHAAMVARRHPELSPRDVQVRVREAFRRDVA